MAQTAEPATPEPAPVGGAPVRPSSPRLESAALAEDVLARRASFAQLNPAGPTGALPLGSLLDVTVTLTAELGRTTITLAEVLRLGAGSVVPLDRLASEPVEITARGVLLARGEVVVVDDRFAVRIKEIVQSRQTAAGEVG